MVGLGVSRVFSGRISPSEFYFVQSIKNIFLVYINHGNNCTFLQNNVIDIENYCVGLSCMLYVKSGRNNSHNTSKM